MSKRNPDGTFKQSPGPGRPKGSKNKATKEFKEAMEAVGTKKGKSLMQHLVERAYESDTVLVQVANKLLPTLKQVDSEIKQDVDGVLKITWSLEDDN